MIFKLDPDDLAVTTFSVAAAQSSALLRYTPDCCTDDLSGCKTGPETGCVETTVAAALPR